MEITGTYLIPAARSEVWQALFTPAVLQACLPGCESVEQTAPDEFRAAIKMAIGPLRARFNGVLRMADVVDSISCTLQFEGQGGMVGFGKGQSQVSLSDVEHGTELRYSAQAQVGGKLAQVGSRLIEGVARKLADDFFKAFQQQLQGAASDQDGAEILSL